MNAPEKCGFCDEMMHHCFNCDENFCETPRCPGNNTGHSWLKCGFKQDVAELGPISEAIRNFRKGKL